MIVANTLRNGGNDMAQNKEEKIKLFKEAVQTDCGDCSKCIFEDDPTTCRLYYAMNFLYEKAKQEIAREIFEDIEKVFTVKYPMCTNPVLVLDSLSYAELKKKYTESEGING